MPSNAPGMRRAGRITSAGWPKLRPDATRARILGTAATVRSDGFPLAGLQVGVRSTCSIKWTRAVKALVVATARRRIDMRRDGARGGADPRASIAVRPHGREEGRVHAAVGAGRYRHGRRAAVGQLHGLEVVTALLLAYRERDILAHPIERASPRGVEAVRGLRVEHVALLADVDLRLEVRDLEMVIALLDHFPECDVGRVTVARHVERRHTERIGLQLERLLAAEECLTRERVDLRDLLVGHGVAAGGGAAAMDHEERAGAAVRSIIRIREAGIDREI